MGLSRMARMNKGFQRRLSRVTTVSHSTCAKANAVQHTRIPKILVSCLELSPSTELHQHRPHRSASLNLMRTRARLPKTSWVRLANGVMISSLVRIQLCHAMEFRFDLVSCCYIAHQRMVDVLLRPPV